MRDRRLLSACVLLLPGCSVFAEDYPEANATALAAFQHGDFEAAASAFAARSGALASDRFLSLAEQGMAWHVAGDLPAATGAWLAALEVLDGFSDRPTISGRSVAEGALSLVLNDKTLPYDGETFETCLLHAFLAWDYLRMGSLDDAMVEVFRGYALQQRDEERFQATYGMNRFARFVAAVAQEMDGAYDEALLDLERLAADVPENRCIQSALRRVRGLDAAPHASAERMRSELILVYEQSRMPAKVAQEITYPGRRTLGRFSVPAFGPARVDADGVRLWLDGADAGRSELLEDVALVARDNLDDRIGWLVAKSALRGAAKTIVIAQIADEVAEEHGEGTGLLFGILAGLLAASTERADLRSWLTLPASIQVLRVPVEPGTHEVALELLGPAGAERVSLGARAFPAGRKVFVAARSLGGRLYACAGAGSTVVWGTQVP